MSSRTRPGTLRGVRGADPGLRGPAATAGRMPPRAGFHRPPGVHQGPAQRPPRARPDPGHARTAALAPAKPASQVTARGTSPPWKRHRIGYPTAVETPPHRVRPAFPGGVAGPEPAPLLGVRSRTYATVCERLPVARERRCRVHAVAVWATAMWVLAVWAEHVDPCRAGHRHMCSTALCSNALVLDRHMLPCRASGRAGAAPPRSMRPPQSVRWPGSTAVSPVR